MLICAKWKLQSLTAQPVIFSSNLISGLPCEMSENILTLSITVCQIPRSRLQLAC